MHVGVGEVDLAIAELRNVVEADAEPHSGENPVAVLVSGLMGWGAISGCVSKIRVRLQIMCVNESLSLERINR